jgi:hypothetical protein
MHFIFPFPFLLILIQGKKEAQEASLRKMGHALSTSLPSISEDDSGAPDTPGDIGQLPTPRETPDPESQQCSADISDALFSLLETPLETDDSSSGRVRTALSGNPLFTIVDRSGIFDMEIIICVCPNSGNTDKQLFRSGLFSATFKQIETLFTFSVLDDFLADNLECKTTAQQYYSKLQSMTNKMFPNSVPVCVSYMLSYRSNQFL